jgi:hypothetical protein
LKENVMPGHEDGERRGHEDEERRGHEDEVKTQICEARSAEH